MWRLHFPNRAAVDAVQPPDLRPVSQVDHPLLLASISSLGRASRPGRIGPALRHDGSVSTGAGAQASGATYKKEAADRRAVPRERRRWPQDHLIEGVAGHRYRTDQLRVRLLHLHRQRTCRARIRSRNEGANRSPAFDQLVAARYERPSTIRSSRRGPGARKRWSPVRDKGCPFSWHTVGLAYGSII